MNERQKKIAWIVMVEAAIVIIAILFYFSFVKSISQKPAISKESRGDDTVGELQNCRVEQDIQIDSNVIDGITIQFATYQKVNQGKVEVQIIDKDTQLTYYMDRFSMNEIEDNVYRYFEFNEKAENVNGHIFSISIQIQGESDQDFITFWSTQTDSRELQASVDGIKIDQIINYQVLSGDNSFIIVVYWVGTVFLLLSMAGILFCMFLKKLSLEKCFVLVAAMIGLIYMAIMPVYSVPDEPAHIDMAYMYSNKLLGVDNTKSIFECKMKRVDDASFFGLSTAPSIRTYRVVYDHFFELAENTECVDTAMRYVNAPFWIYMPSAIGISLGRLLNLGTLLVYQLGRCMNFTVFLVCMYYAIKRTPIGKMAFFVLGLLPMTMQLVISCSYDAIILSIAFMFIASMFKTIYAKEKVTIKSLIIPFVFGALLAPCKGGVYLPICMLILLIPTTQYAKISYKRLAIVSFLIVVLGSFCLISLSATINATITNDSSISWTSVRGFTISDFIDHPFYFVKIMLNTIYVKGDFYFFSLFGQSLGWFNIPIQYIVIIGYLICFMLSLISSESETFSISIGSRVFSVILCIGSAGLSMVAMLLNWTPINYKAIEGVQGRYFMPFMPLFALILHNKTIVLKRNIDYQLMLSMICLQLITIVEILYVILSR